MNLGFGGRAVSVYLVVLFNMAGETSVFIVCVLL